MKKVSVNQANDTWNTIVMDERNILLFIKIESQVAGRNIEVTH